MMERLIGKRTPSVLGLALDGQRLHGAVLRRSNGSIQVKQTLDADLTLDPVSQDWELVGREIRNHLDQAGIRERRCVVAVPLKWAMTLHVSIPDLPEADVESYLQIEAERGFPYGQEMLSMGISRYTLSNGTQLATLVAVAKNPLEQLEKALKAARLKPASVGLGITALVRAEDESPTPALMLFMGRDTIDLQVNYAGGVASLRCLEGVIETDGMHQVLQTDVLFREIRITLGQLPDEIREAIHAVQVFGRGEKTERWVEEMQPAMSRLGLNVRQVKDYAASELDGVFPPNTAVSTEVSAAAHHLTKTPPRFEFLPPRQNAWQQFSTKVNSRKLVWGGATAAALVVLSLFAVLFQQWRLSTLEEQWTVMEPQVNELDEWQQQIKRFRPWFDRSYGNLEILRQLTETFPEAGVVSAKTVEIRNLSQVNCSGIAEDNQAFLEMLDQLRALKNVGNLKVDQVRGKTPVQFAFNFQWGEGAGP